MHLSGRYPAVPQQKVALPRQQGEKHERCINPFRCCFSGIGRNAVRSKRKEA
jgi:hypothetical protein